MADTRQKYLNEAGVQTLWNAVKQADTAVADAKVGYISVDGNTMHLWKDEATYNAAKEVSPLTGFISSVDVSSFLTDGMLEHVEIVQASEDNQIDGSTEGTFIKFTWKDADGDGTKDNVTYLPASEIGKIYTAGTGISINAETDNTISVSDAPATEILTTELIPTAGGPLATYAATVYPNGIPVGTDMQALLFSLFCKEEWPTSTTSTAGSVSVSMGNPTMSTTAPSGTYEIGTVLSLGDVTISSAASANVTTYPKVSGFTYGYSAEDDNEKDSSNTSISATVKTAAAVDSTNYSISADYTNFLQTDGTTAMADIAASEHTAATYNDATVKIPATDVVVASGTNTVTYSAKGPKGTVTFNSIPSYYAVSNIGKTHADDGTVYYKSDEVAESTKTSAQASTSLKVTVTGKYKYFIGYFNDTQFDNKTYTSDFIRDTASAGTLLTSGWMDGTNINYTAAVPAGSYGLYIAIPTGVDDSGASLKVFQPSANVEVQDKMATDWKRTLSVNCGGSHKKDYVIFTWVYNPGTAGEEKFNITSF